MGGGDAGLAGESPAQQSSGRRRYELARDFSMCASMAMGGSASLLRDGPFDFAQGRVRRPSSAVAIHAVLKNKAASGGNVSFSENGRPCTGLSSA